MPQSNILVVVIDGLRASALGAYGNTTCATPALDHLAAQSMTFDACFAPAIELEKVYRALWQSEFLLAKAHVTKVESVQGSVASLPALLRNIGFWTTLVTDEPKLASFAGHDDFDECVHISPVKLEVERATDAADTSLAKLFAAACDAIAEANDLQGVVAGGNKKRPQLLWVHARGMNGPWDAPLELQEAMLDESDPPPIESAAVPELEISQIADPDLAFRFGTAYAAQVVVLDECWRELGEIITATDPNPPWLIVLMGARGFSLGEHERIGSRDDRLPVEQLHVPWFIQFPDGRCQLARSSALVSHYDLLPTLMEWCGIDATVPPAAGSSVLSFCDPAFPKWRDALLSMDDCGAFALRTTGWCLRGTIDGQHEEVNDTARLSSPANERLELFVRPDDRWEANDVAKLCPDIVEELHADAHRRMQQAARGESIL